MSLRALVSSIDCLVQCRKTNPQCRCKLSYTILCLRIVRLLTACGRGRDKRGRRRSAAIFQSTFMGKCGNMWQHERYSWQNVRAKIQSGKTLICCTSVNIFFVLTPSGSQWSMVAADARGFKRSSQGRCSRTFCAALDRSAATRAPRV